MSFGIDGQAAKDLAAGSFRCLFRRSIEYAWNDKSSSVKLLQLLMKASKASRQKPWCSSVEGTRHVRDMTSSLENVLESALFVFRDKVVKQ